MIKQSIEIKLATFKILAFSGVVLANFTIAETFFVTFLGGCQKSKEKLDIP